ncbi:hypothetical protein M501DRAFT_1027585 [Patellaria atrata CBS 101060]|uniref:Uncharacterized protein n=1 Tax=Patellaria atrata CBS 101060 TaxID=1346257 RepID=A0A9P4SJF8_9PEZI|nr:hypothetical protein M501DRAFT_1027585 [Patellaria atrata CBS 101060]
MLAQVLFFATLTSSFLQAAAHEEHAHILVSTETLPTTVYAPSPSGVAAVDIAPEIDALSAGPAMNIIISINTSTPAPDPAAQPPSTVTVTITAGSPTASTDAPPAVGSGTPFENLGGGVPASTSEAPAASSAPVASSTPAASSGPAASSAQPTSSSPATHACVAPSNPAAKTISKFWGDAAGGGAPSRSIVVVTRKMTITTTVKPGASTPASSAPAGSGAPLIVVTATTTRTTTISPSDPAASTPAASAPAASSALPASSPAASAPAPSDAEGTPFESLDGGAAKPKRSVRFNMAHSTFETLYRRSGNPTVKAHTLKPRSDTPSPALSVKPKPKPKPRVVEPVTTIVLRTLVVTTTLGNVGEARTTGRANVIGNGNGEHCPYPYPGETCRGLVNGDPNPTTTSVVTVTR